jgi:hypothetical protein
MATKITKEDLAIILKRISKHTDAEDMLTEIECIADEYRIDLTEPDADEELDDRNAYSDEFVPDADTWDISDDEDDY